MTGTGTSLSGRLRWPWVVLAVVLFLAALLTGTLQSCSQASGPPVCEPSLHPVVPLSLGALGIAAVVVAVRRPDSGTAGHADGPDHDHGGR